MRRCVGRPVRDREKENIMAYSDLIKIRAYALFIQGISYEEIARQITDEFGKKLSAGTVRKWAEAADAKGFTWIDYRQETRVIARQSIEAREQNRLVAVRDKAVFVMDKIYDKLSDDKAAPKISSFDGGAYAFKTIAEFALKLDDKAASQPDIIFVIQTVLDIFAEIPEVRDVIQANWALVEKEIRIRILHENPEKENEAKQLGTHG